MPFTCPSAFNFDYHAEAVMLHWQENERKPILLLQEQAENDREEEVPATATSSPSSSSPEKDTAAQDLLREWGRLDEQESNPNMDAHGGNDLMELSETTSETETQISKESQENTAATSSGATITTVSPVVHANLLMKQIQSNARIPRLMDRPWNQSLAGLIGPLPFYTPTRPPSIPKLPWIDITRLLSIQPMDDYMALCLNRLLLPEHQQSLGHLARVRRRRCAQDLVTQWSTKGSLAHETTSPTQQDNSLALVPYNNSKQTSDAKALDKVQESSPAPESQIIQQLQQELAKSRQENARLRAQLGGGKGEGPQQQQQQQQNQTAAASASPEEHQATPSSLRKRLSYTQTAHESTENPAKRNKFMERLQGMSRLGRGRASPAKQEHAQESSQPFFGGDSYQDVEDDAMNISEPNANRTGFSFAQRPNPEAGRVSFAGLGAPNRSDENQHPGNTDSGEQDPKLDKRAELKRERKRERKEERARKRAKKAEKAEKKKQKAARRHESSEAKVAGAAISQPSTDADLKHKTTASLSSSQVRRAVVGVDSKKQLANLGDETLDNARQGLNRTAQKQAVAAKGLPGMKKAGDPHDLQHKQGPKSAKASSSRQSLSLPRTGAASATAERQPARSFLATQRQQTEAPPSTAKSAGIISTSKTSAPQLSTSRRFPFPSATSKKRVESFDSRKSGAFATKDSNMSSSKGHPTLLIHPSSRASTMPTTNTAAAFPQRAESEANAAVTRNSFSHRQRETTATQPSEANQTSQFDFKGPRTQSTHSVNPTSTSGMEQARITHPPVIESQMPTPEANGTCRNRENQSPRRVICAEQFLVSYPGIVAELGSGRWAALKLETQTNDPLHGSSIPAGSPIELVDSPLVDPLGVDIELPNRSAIMLMPVSLLQSESAAKQIVISLAHQAALGRYQRLHVLLSYDVDLTDEIVQHITHMQSASLCLGYTPPTAMFFKTATPVTLSACIASTVFALPPTTNYDQVVEAVSRGSFNERAWFLSMLAPKLTASGAIQIFLAAQQMARQPVSLAMLFQSNALKTLMSGPAGHQYAPEVHLEACYQLRQALEVSLRT